MSVEFKYSVVSKNADGEKSTAKFTNPKSAYMWAERLQQEGTEFTVYVKSSRPVEFSTVTITLGNLKKQAGPIVNQKKTK